MKTRISIRTPKGQAKKTNERIKPFIIGFKKVDLTTYVSNADDEIIWDIDGDPKKVMKIIRNVGLFDTFVKSIMNNSIVKKAIRSKLKKEDEGTLKDMLENQTKLEIIDDNAMKEILDSKKYTLIEKR